MNKQKAIELVRERVEQLPDGVWDCEGCGSEDSMAIRRSGMNHSAYANDVILKCMECWRIRTHGIPYESEEQFHKEKELRGQRILDFAKESGVSDDVADNLEALGYVGKAESVKND